MVKINKPLHTPGILCSLTRKIELITKENLHLLATLGMGDADVDHIKSVLTTPRAGALVSEAVLLVPFENYYTLNHLTREDLAEYQKHPERYIARLRGLI